MRGERERERERERPKTKTKRVNATVPVPFQRNQTCDECTLPERKKERKKPQ